MAIPIVAKRKKKWNFFQFFKFPWNKSLDFLQVSPVFLVYTTIFPAFCFLGLTFTVLKEVSPRFSLPFNWKPTRFTSIFFIFNPKYLFGFPSVQPLVTQKKKWYSGPDEYKWLSEDLGTFKKVATKTWTYKMHWRCALFRFKLYNSEDAESNALEFRPHSRWCEIRPPLSWVLRQERYCLTTLARGEAM